MDPARCSILLCVSSDINADSLMDGILYLIFYASFYLQIPRKCVYLFILTVSIVGSMIHQGMIKMPGFWFRLCI